PQEANEREKEDSQLESLEELVVLLLGPALPGLGYGIGLAGLLGGVLGRRDGRGADEARDRHAQGPTLLLAMVNREDATGGAADSGSRSTVGRRISMDHKEETWSIWSRPIEDGFDGDMRKISAATRSGLLLFTPLSNRFAETAAAIGGHE
ncbi:hypothetical protein B296_00017017, partial [Ensete ventricosum]